MPAYMHFNSVHPPLALPCRRYLYVADLASLPAQRGKGYGKALMSEMETIALNAGCKRWASRVSYAAMACSISGTLL